MSQKPKLEKRNSKFGAEATANLRVFFQYKGHREEHAAVSILPGDSMGDKVNVQLACLFGLVSISMPLSSCKKPAAIPDGDKGAKPTVQVQFEEPPTVLFDIKSESPVSDPYGSHLYDCTYQAGAKTAKFRIEFRQKGPLSGEIPMAAVEGKFLAVPGSDNSVLLEDLKKALEANVVPKKSARVAELSFDAVILADRMSRNASGGYSDRPPGDWKMIKVFLPMGGDDGELFLNLNSVLGKAEFSIKDPEYGDYLLAQLAKVL